MNDEGEDIPGLAEYLPMVPHTCDQCGARNDSVIKRYSKLINLGSTRMEVPVRLCKICFQVNKDK